MLVLKGGMVDSSDHDSAAKESAIDLEVTGSGPVGCHFPTPSLYFICKSIIIHLHSTTLSVSCILFYGSKFFMMYVNIIGT